MIRRAYIRQVKDRLDRLEGDVDHLLKGMVTPAGDISDRVDREIRGLQSKAERVRERIYAVESAGAAKWGILKHAVEDGLKELGRAVDEAVARFRKTGAGDR